MDEEQERYTRDLIDPVTGKEYTLNVYPYSWGYKYDIRDNEQGTVIQDGGVNPSFSVALEDARQWAESRDDPAIDPGAAKAAPKSALEITVAHDGNDYNRYIACIGYPDSDFRIAWSESYSTREEAMRAGEALLPEVQAQEERQGGRSMKVIDITGRIVRYIETPENEAAVHYAITHPEVTIEQALAGCERDDEEMGR
jgi:hypothetical protein